MRWRLNIEVYKPGWSAPLIFTLEGPETSPCGLYWRLTEIRKKSTDHMAVNSF